MLEINSHKMDKPIACDAPPFHGETSGDAIQKVARYSFRMCMYMMPSLSGHACCCKNFSMMYSVCKKNMNPYTHEFKLSTVKIVKQNGHSNGLPSADSGGGRGNNTRCLAISDDEETE
jgi:hypothetical protein